LCALAARVVLSFASAKGGHHAVDSGAVLGAVNASALRAARA
jgi:hypothetical protein